MIRTIIFTILLSFAFNAKADAIDSVLRVLDHEIEVAPTTYLPEKESIIDKLRKTSSETENAPDAHYLTNPQAYRITKKKVNSKTALKMAMAPGGGFAISIKPVK